MVRVKRQSGTDVSNGIELELAGESREGTESEGDDEIGGKWMFEQDESWVVKWELNELMSKFVKLIKKKKIIFTNLTSRLIKNL